MPYLFQNNYQQMIVQVLAKDLPIAQQTLDSVGGHITSRKTKLLNTTEVLFESKEK